MKAKTEFSQAIHYPHITEKATSLNTVNQYVFKIDLRSNKTAIANEVEKIWGIKPKKVRIIYVPPKQRRLGRTQGFRKGYKKAIVTLPEGKTIELVPK